MERGQTFQDDAGQFVVLSSSADSLEVVERFEKGKTTHWHKFNMPKAEAEQFNKGDTLNEDKIEISQKLAETDPENTPMVEGRLLG